MDEQRKVLRVFIDAAIPGTTRHLIRQRLEQEARFELVDNPNWADIQLGMENDIIDVAALRYESQVLTERMIGQLKADHDGNVAHATEQCAGDDPTPMRGDGRRTLRSNANGTMTWPEAKRSRSRK